MKNTPTSVQTLKVYVKKKDAPNADDAKQKKNKKGIKVEKNKSGQDPDPKVLFYDIETGPNLGYVYGKYEQNVLGDFVEEWELLSFAFKWMGERAIKAYGQDTMSEEELVGELHELLDEADVVIAHNGDRFDQRMANAKFIEYQMDPPAPYRSIDTLKVARRYFRFNSNKLDDLGNKLGVGRKLQVGGFAVWRACLEGDPKAWKKMLQYNKQDVQLLEDVYYKLRPWMDNHPPMNVYLGVEDGCPKCGSEELQKRGTRKVNKTTTVQRYQCNDCGGWCQHKKSDRVDVNYVN
jgi:uncharacterized protein YprB with RNaseH-like and TPR domain